MNPRLFLGGLKSYLPLHSDYTGTGGTVSGRYCYSVWLRHLSILNRYVPGFRPRTVVEVGPGDSIGLGIAALLSGVDRYQGLDVLQHASVDTNLRVLDELVELYRELAPIPDEADFPRLHPRLESYDFPAAVVGEGLDDRLSPASIDQLRRAVVRAGDGSAPPGAPLQYICPWSSSSVDAGSADLVVSQVVLQDMDHAPRGDTLRRTFEAMAGWLRAGGVMSHQINFSFPGELRWNEHWAYGDAAWTIIRGRRPYYENRAPLSAYLSLFDDAGCEVVGIKRLEGHGLRRDQVAPRFRHLPDDDFTTSAALIVATRRGAPSA